MLKTELHKLLFRRKGLILLIVMLSAQLAFLFLFTRPYDILQEENRGVYDSCLARVEGALTQENRQWIEAEMDALTENRRNLENLRTQYYSGEVTTEAYKSQLPALMNADAAYSGFSCLYKQYIFVRENPQREFLYTGGWEVLLRQQEPQYLLLLLLIFLLIPIFCQEYGCQMDEILLTQKKSGGDTWKGKVGAAFLLTGSIVAFWELSRLLYCAVVFGLPNWHCSLNSLYSFGDTTKGLSLWSAWLLQFALRELGYLACAGYILFFCVAFRKYSLSLAASLIFLPLPFLTVPSTASFLRLPGPWAMTLGSIFLNGAAFYSGTPGLMDTAGFQELSWGELSAIVAAVLVILGAQLLYIRRRNQNQHCRKRWLAAACCLLPLLLTGCKGAQTTDIIYNSADACNFENADTMILNFQNTRSIFIDLTTEKVYPFPLQALPESAYEFSAPKCLYEQDGFLYYLEDSGYSLMQLNLRTLQKTVYASWETPPRWFFGLLKVPDQEPVRLSSFFLHGNTLYGFGSSGMLRLNLKTGHWQPLPQVQDIHYAYDGQHLYYPDPYSCLVQENLDTGERRTLEDVVVSAFRLTPEGIYFLNRQDKDALYLWDGAAAHRLCDGNGAYGIYWDRDYLWLQGADSLIRMEHNGNNQTAFPLSGLLIHMGLGDSFLYADAEDNIYRADKDTLKAVRQPSLQVPPQ